MTTLSKLSPTDELIAHAPEPRALALLTWKAGVLDRRIRAGGSPGVDTRAELARIRRALGWEG